MGINWANEASINQTRPAGHRRIAVVDIDGSGASSHTVTGIPSDAAEVNIHMYNYSLDTSGSDIMKLRVGNGSVDSGNNYSWGCNDGSGNQQGSNGNNFFRCMQTSHTGASHVVSGTINLIRATHTEGTAYSGWTIKAFMGDNNNNMVFTSIGRYHTIGVIDRIQVFNGQSRGYDSGGRMIVTVSTGSLY